MLPIFLLYKDIYDERWGDPQKSGRPSKANPALGRHDGACRSWLEFSAAAANG